MGGRLWTICGCLAVLLVVGPRLGHCESPTDLPEEEETNTTTTVATETTTCNDRGDRDCPNLDPSATPPVGATTPGSVGGTNTAAPEQGSTTAIGDTEQTSQESMSTNTTTADVSVAVTSANDTSEITAATEPETEGTATNASDTVLETTTPLLLVNATSDMEDTVNTTESVTEVVTTATNASGEVTEQANTTVDVPTTAKLPLDVPIQDDPCTDYVEGSGIYYKTLEEEENCTEIAVFNTSTWTRFQLNGTDASIPTEGIKTGYCGANYPYRIFLDGGELPNANDTVDAYLCTHVTSPYEDYCEHRRGAKIHNCNDRFYVYQILYDIDAGQTCTGICLTYADESIGNEHLANPPTTTSAPEPTTEEPEIYPLPRLTDLTESQENGTVTIEYKFPESEDENNVTAYWAVHKDEKFRSFISRILNKCVPKKVAPEPEADTTTVTTVTTVVTVSASQSTKAAATTTTTPKPTEQESPFEIVEEIIEDTGEESPQVTKTPMGGVVLEDNTDNDAGKGPSRRSAPAIDGCGDKYTKDDVFYVYDTPKVVNGILQISFVVVKLPSNSTSSRRKRDVGDGGDVVSSKDLFDALNDVDPETYEDELDLKYVRHYEGEPVDPKVEAPEEAHEGTTDPHTASIWDAHMGLFIAIIILIILCILVVIIGILCIKCKGRKYTPEKTPLRSEEGMSPMVMENPITDEEIVKGEAPMTESQNPAYTPNGSGQHLTKGDEENGWIVPLDELTYAERERPEVDNTRL